MKRLVGIALVAGLLFSGAATAQQGPAALTETLALPGGHTIGYPAGWLVNLTGLPIIATNAGVVATMQRNVALPDGGIGFGVIPPAGASLLGITYTPSAEEMIAAYAAFFGGETAITPLDGATMPAFVTPLTGSSRLPPGARLVTFETGGEAFAILVVAADFEFVLPLLHAMMGSVGGG